ncbi:uncharacterized protein EI90DRAFT_3053919 [Cantharellus anzutake]|uniref:uncharacterized protein n=1 Tax=Cantharellus anzutake TaxID=1750568 RepID=UPI0019043422|nr:uncharacterized protein EI90DRAFT_3053919 [Cantharellus anzutake]KAF8332655.1 hypothetical protein EI90DRAFT_3053919 [Cantharellus anzutake]
MPTQRRSQCASGGHSRQLNNFLQSCRGSHSLTWEEKTVGPLHRITWSVVCKIDGHPVGEAQDLKKNIARDQAARDALIALGVIYPDAEAGN